MIIPGFSAYDISEDGVVTHVASGKVIKYSKAQSKSGYYTYVRVNIKGDDGKQHTCNVLRLLALTFLGAPSQPCVARAKDGDNTNITLENVEWSTYADGPANAWQDGKYSKRTPRKRKCCTKDSMSFVLTTLEQLDYPVSTIEVSRMLDLPYSVARYTLIELLDEGKVKHIDGRGFVIV